MAAAKGDSYAASTGYFKMSLLPLFHALLPPYPKALALAWIPPQHGREDMMQGHNFL